VGLGFFAEGHSDSKRGSAKSEKSAKVMMVQRRIEKGKRRIWRLGGRCLGFIKVDVVKAKGLPSRLFFELQICEPGFH
jgi:hypothetical protein